MNAHLAADLLGARFCRENGISPNGFDGTTIDVGVPRNPTQFEELGRTISVLTGYPIRFVEQPPEELRAQIEAAFGPPRSLGEQRTDIEHLWDQILHLALDHRASNILIEYFRAPDGKDAGRVRLDAHGDLDTVLDLDFPLFDRLTAWLLTHSLEGETVSPLVGQRGRLSEHVDGRELNLRLSSFPIYHPSRTGLIKIALRVLRRNEYLPPLDRLGATPDNVRFFEEQMRNPQCTLLIGAAPGQGKSTTFYSLFRSLPMANMNIYSIEDPPEIFFPDITQTPIRRAHGWTYSEALTELLRQTPRFVFVGEILDRAIADIVMTANRRGVAIGSTIHADDALSIIPALRNLNVSPLTISSGLTGLASQRLVQILCPSCRIKAVPQASVLRYLHRLGIGTNKITLYERGPGCERCLQRGILRRVAVIETLTLTSEMLSAVARSDDRDFVTIARGAGYVTMLEEALLLALRGEIAQSALSTFPDSIAHGAPPSPVAENFFARLSALRRTTEDARPA